MSTETIGEKLGQIRGENNLPLRKAAALIDIDVPILSKMERGERKQTKEIVRKLDEIKLDFYWWEKGPYRFDIWHWFDEKLQNGLAVDF